MEPDTSCRALLDLLRPAVWTLDATGHVVAVSAGVEDLTGWPPEQMADRPWRDVAADLNLPDLTAHHFETPPATWPPLHRHEDEITTHAGGVRYASVSVVKVPEAAEPQWLVVMEDITANRRAADSLTDSELRYAALFENLVAGVVVADMNGRVLDANRTACEVLGYTRAELLELRLQQLATAETIRSLPDLNTPEMRTGGLSFEVVARRAGGDTFPAEIHVQLLTIAGQDLAVIHFRDVTARQRAQMALQESNETAWAMLNATHDMAMLMDTQGIVLGANEAIARSLGTTVAELLGANGFALLPMPMRQYRWQRMQECITSGQPVHFEDERDGRHLTSSLYPIVGARGQVTRVAIFAQNVTERLHAEEAHRLATVGQLAAGLAHEFNNILAGLLLSAESASYHRENQEYERLTELVLRSSNRGAEICRNLMAFAKPRQPRRQAMYIEEAIEGALSLAARQLEAGGITVKRSYRSQGRRLLGDPAQLEQVFLNLIINACHAMPDGGVLTMETLFQEHPGEPGDIVAHVIDNGAGIPAENLPRVFEPFFTTKGRLGRSELPGTGLGLSVSLGIVKSHGGQISAQSVIDVGTTFTLRFGACEDAGVEATAPAEFRVNGGLKPGLRVLLAEDEAEVRQSLAQILARDGYRVSAVASATEALTLLERESFDVVVTDLLMPGGGGKAVLLALERLPVQPPVLIITGHSMELSEEVAPSRMCVKRLLKPFIADEFRVALTDLLHEYRGRGHGQSGATSTTPPPAADE